MAVLCKHVQNELVPEAYVEQYNEPSALNEIGELIIMD
jgi:hypothetical protein